MDQAKTQLLISGIVLTMLFLSACGTPQADLDATAAQVATEVSETKTAAAPSPMPSPTPTIKPSSTPTPTLTPTPIPGPDAKAMINWEALNLPEGYQSLNPHELGFGEGDWIMGIQQGDGTQVDYTIESSFVFGKAWPEAAYGWTVLFPTDFDLEVLDWYIDNFASQLAGIIESSQGQLISLIDNSENPKYSIIGDNSSEAWSVYIAEGQFWVLWGAAFRIDNIGGFVFLRHSFENEQFMEIGDLAQIYAESIETPTYSCNFTTITPDSDSDLPAFEYKVEGFYPGEPIMVSLSGNVRVDGETQRVTAIDYDTDSAYENGKFHGKMKFGDEVLELASSEFELMIMGYFSNCVVSQLVTWPGELVLSTTPEPTSSQPDPTSSTSPIFKDDFNQQLEDGWEWLYESKDRWNLHEKPGFLHFEVALDTKQFLARNAPEGNFEITTRVLITPHQNFQFAGLFILQDDGHKLMFGRGFAYFPDAECCIGNALYYDNQDKILGVPEQGYAINLLSPTKTDELDEAYLRLTREGKTYTAYYSNDGENWTTIGKHKVGWVPVYVGIMARGNQNSTSVDADFDYFTLNTLP